MLRGINRQVVEVSEPENVYFEKVLFFVKPEYYGMSEAVIRKKAGVIMEEKSRPPVSAKPSGRKRVLISVLKTAAAVLVGAAVTALIFLICL